MFREMRRKRQLLSGSDTEAVLDRGSHGILACVGDEGYPYAVPLNYAYTNQTIYFHSAKSGHKIDAILKHPKVSFAVVDEDTIVSAEYTSYFRSVIAFGHARQVEGEERFVALRALVEKYSAERPEEEKQKEINRCEHAVIVAIDIDHMTGKEAKELIDAKS